MPNTGPTNKYSISFTAVGGTVTNAPLIAPSHGGFYFDDGARKFSNFIIVWNGLKFDLTAQANGQIANGQGQCMGLPLPHPWIYFESLIGRCGSQTPRWVLQIWLTDTTTDPASAPGTWVNYRAVLIVGNGSPGYALDVSHEAIVDVGPNYTGQHQNMWFYHGSADVSPAP